MRPSRSLASALVLSSLAAVGGCNHSDADDKAVVLRSPAPAAAPRTLSAGDVRIATADGGIDMSLIGDTISTGLSEASLAKSRKEMDTTAVQGSGFGASIEKMVKTTVSGALGTRVGVSLKDVKGARYENGRITFDWSGTPSRIFDQTKVDKRPLLEAFAPADAQRFVDAVNARKKDAR